MTGILAEIVEYKRSFVAGSKRATPRGLLEERAADAGPTRGFIDAISACEGCALIAEIKTASPSKGLIRDDFTVEEVARLYGMNGATCISVLTDERYFHGSLDRLGRARSVTGLPLLRKDFIVDPYQVLETRVAGADAILLIMACLDDMAAEEFMGYAAELGLDCLVEVHDEQEMDRASQLCARLVGINNRDLRTFETRLDTTARLAGRARETSLLVSESGISTAEDVIAVHGMGANAVLVGEAIMREQDIAAKVRELSRAVAGR